MVSVKHFVLCKIPSAIKFSVHKTSHKTNKPSVHTNIALSTKQMQASVDKESYFRAEKSYCN